MALRMTVYQCGKCGHKQSIPQGYCSRCRSANSCKPVIQEIAGTVFSYTKVHVCEERFKSEAPYLLAVIECGDGLRVMGRVRQTDGQLGIGSRAELAGFQGETPLFKVTGS